MSDATNDVPLDPGSTISSPEPTSTASDPGSSDPDASDQDQDLDPPTDPSDDGTVNDPNGSNIIDPATGSDQNGADGDDPNSTGNVPPSTVADSPVPSLPVTTPQSAASAPTASVDGPGSGMQPSAVPNSIPEQGGSTRDSPLSLGSSSDSQAKTIIIASSVSGSVALVLVLVVILFVYRRRVVRRREVTFVNAVRQANRRGSDATWIGPPAGISFDNDKLEAGNRESDASFESEATTLADFAAARSKSGAFSTSSHTPKPSLDKIEPREEPLVPDDPFEKPRLSIVDKPRSSLDRAVAELVALPRQKKSPAPSIRIDSNSTLNGSVQIEQGDVVCPRSPGSPFVPLVTPIEPPPGWRGSQVEYIPAPTRRDSMVSLSRQSSRASSRNSQIIEVVEEKRASVNTAFSATLARKRRSRADSIDPFRKSSATISARRKSRAESVASARYKAYIATPSHPAARRKSRADSVAPPMSPGGRRKSSVASRRSSQVASSMDTPEQSAVFSALVNVTRSTPMGLPRTPRTPTAARQSRVPLSEPRTPTARTPRAPPSRELRAPVSREPRTPVSAREPRTPATVRTPRTPGGHPRTPSTRVPRTPTSLEDAVPWSSVPLPTVPVDVPTPSSRPLPTVPTTPIRAPAELRLSQLSRALSEVSSKDSLP
ncbi:hypothetical protein BD414DRAFT_534024 [Trametes punicea]|nr:hypothetical protein BD414DRAFT_534024 [Trametes punicea]